MANPASFHAEAMHQGACAGCGERRDRLERRGIQLRAHHVVYRQHCRRAGAGEYDPRNARALCDRCHEAHHAHGVVDRPLALARLTDANVEFAFEALGPAAYDYLLARYSGGADGRLEAALTAVVVL